MSHKSGIECQVVQVLGVQQCFKYTDSVVRYTRLCSKVYMCRYIVETTDSHLHVTLIRLQQK